jgi:hypothetical protein
MSTQQILAQGVKDDLKPQSPEHRVRLIGAAFVSGLGGFDIVISRFFRDQPWSWESLILVLFGVGIVFTGTIIKLAKALLPWVRNGV